MSNLFFLVGTTIGERLLYPLTAGWALLVTGWAARARVVRWAAAGLLATRSSREESTECDFVELLSFDEVFCFAFRKGDSYWIIGYQDIPWL